MGNDFVPREPEIEFYIETDKDVAGNAGDLIRYEPIGERDGAFVPGASAVYRDDFNPAREITVPVRISQALGDHRVKADKTRRLIGRLRELNGEHSVTEVYYAVPAGVPDPQSLGDHFALLVGGGEIQAVVDWLEGL